MHVSLKKKEKKKTLQLSCLMPASRTATSKELVKPSLHVSNIVSNQTGKEVTVTLMLKYLI